MYASYYTREVMVVLVREFQTPDEEMKKIVLKARRPGAWASGLQSRSQGKGRRPDNG